MVLMAIIGLLAAAAAGIWYWATTTGSAATLEWIDARFSRSRAVELVAGAAYGDHAAVIAENAPRWTRETFAQIEAHLAALVEAGLLNLPREQLTDLAVNATILLRFGLEHERELGVPTASGTGAVRRTLLRHLALFEHALAPAAAAELKAAIEAIDAEEPLAA